LGRRVKNMSIKCEVCLVNNAQVKDYRYRTGTYNKYAVCRNCFMLDDESFFKLKYAKEGIAKKRVISMIIGGNRKGYLLKEE
jgi:hypothetical protein